jgi:hypothetical protein
MARIEVSLGLWRAAEPPVTPAHLDVSRDLVQLTGSPLTNGSQPADAWLPTLLGKDLEPNQSKELLPIPRRGNAEAQGLRGAGP